MELLVAIAVLAMIVVALSGISLGFLTRISDDTQERQGDATTAQWASVTFARDVQGALGTSPECAPGEGSRLVTLRQSGAAAKDVEYRVIGSSGAFSLVRADCSTATQRTVVRDLVDAPTVSCDDGACAEDDNPRRVALHISRRATFGFELDGVRRTTDGHLAPDVPPTKIPAFVSLGGDAMTVQGNAKFAVNGDAYLNDPTNGTIALLAKGNAKVNITGDLRTEPGSTVRAEGNASINKQSGTLAGPFPDPLRFLPTPDPTDLPTRTSCEPSNGKFICEPGIYTNSSFPPDTNGVTGNSSFILQPGTYILRGSGGFNPGSNYSVESNGGVFFYVEFGQTNLTGNGTVSLRAPETGIYAGILFFQARNNASDVTVQGNKSLEALDGLIYAPGSASMKLSGGNGDLVAKSVIGSNISVQGNGKVVIGDG